MAISIKSISVAFKPVEGSASKHDRHSSRGDAEAAAAAAARGDSGGRGDEDGARGEAAAPRRGEPVMGSTYSAAQRGDAANEYLTSPATRGEQSSSSEETARGEASG
jgi:hypothetical protein